MIRLFIKDPLNQQATVALPENHVHYLLHVMRQKKGDEVSLFNGKDGEWIGTIDVLDKRQGVITVTRQIKHQVPERQIILCPALIKKENMDLVFQKATELGVSEIFPLLTDRTVVHKLNMARAESIVTEAAEQCERLTIPIIHEPRKLRELWKELPERTQVVCLSERGQNAGKIGENTIPALCVGPEGGWTDTEIAEFNRNKAVFWHFGHTILRAETASIVAMACIQSQ
ncbi:MAG: RsmE family RNA methyltransferase [Pseudomonadota bacterium]|nr:RsmE family RNA methyltransferase [Pseudomonadota bacterium]